MVNFHNAYYRTKRRPEHWLWEYQTYDPRSAVFAVGEDNGKVVATSGALPICMEVGTECVLASKSENFLCLPAYRLTGVMRNLVKYADENCIARGVQFKWGLGPAAKSLRKTSYALYPDIEVLTRPGNIWVDMVSRLQDNTPLWRRLGSIGKLILKSFSNYKRIPEVERRAGYEIRKGRIPGEDLKSLYDRIKSRNGNVICIKYDERFLSWRVRGHPFLKYDEYQVYEGGKMRAYAITTLFKGVVSISDILSEDGYATSVLLHTILRDYRGAGRFRFMGNPKDYLAEGIFKELRRFGFSVAMNWDLTVKDLAGTGDERLFDIRNWHINGLWSEGYLY